jgi:Icc-related predicted phosphoesterase
MKKLQAIQNKITRSICDGDRYATNISIHMALGVRTSNEEIKTASTKLYQPIREHNNPIVAALGNCDIDTYCSYTRRKH